MISKARLQQLAKKHGTPLFIIDHDALRAAYRQFRKHLPRIQVYYAVKANPDPMIVRTLFQEGASFDVASMPEFKIVYDNIKKMPAKERQQWIWDKIIYANPTKPTDTLEQLNKYKPLVTFDNLEEIQKIILQGGNTLQIAEAAKNAGVNDLRASALLKVKKGMTSLAEIDRVTKD